MTEEKTKISIPTILYEKIAEKLEKPTEDAVAQYIQKILEDNLSKQETDEASLSEEDEEKVKERLKALGYMD